VHHALQKYKPMNYI